MGAQAKIARMFCAQCGAELPPQAAGRGRPRLTCSDKCRQRRRRHTNALPWPPVAPASYPSDPETVSKRTAEALVLAMTTDVAAPPEDQLAQGLLELDWIVYHLARLEKDLPVRLGGRAAELAKEIQRARAHCFPVEVPA